MSQKTIGQLKGILGEAVDEGILSSNALAVIDVNETVLVGINGTDIDDIVATDVTLLTLIYDDSGSITSSNLAGPVRDGQNMMIDAIAASKQKDNILIAQWKLGSVPELIHSYVPVDQAVRLDKHNYNPRSGTALYDTWVQVAAANVGYAQQLRASGTPVKNILVIITDGQDCGSRKYREAECRKINNDLLRSEQFILAFVGMGKNPQDEAEFRTVAEDMGFPEGAVLTATMTPSDIRNVFGMVSQSAIRASQKAVSAVAQNSFFTP